MPGDVGGFFSDMDSVSAFGGGGRKRLNSSVQFVQTKSQQTHHAFRSKQAALSNIISDCEV
jgi:hypothetical protein